MIILGCKKYGDKIANMVLHIFMIQKKDFLGDLNSLNSRAQNWRTIKEIKKGKSILEDEQLWDPIFMASLPFFWFEYFVSFKKIGFETVLDGISLLPYKKYSLNFIP